MGGKPLAGGRLLFFKICFKMSGSFSLPVLISYSLCHSICQCARVLLKQHESGLIPERSRIGIAWVRLLRASIFILV